MRDKEEYTIELIVVGNILKVKITRILLLKKKIIFSVSFLFCNISCMKKWFTETLEAHVEMEWKYRKKNKKTGGDK